MNTNNYTADIFDQLSKGNFICSNAIESDQRYLFQYTEEHYEELKEKFEEIGFTLESGNNYYYFSKPIENNHATEAKINKALRWLDILAFFTTFRKDLCRGARFTPHDILSQVDVNLSLREQLSAISKRSSTDKNFQEMVSALLKELQRDGFIDMENELNQTWKLLDAWDYMEQIVMAVSITQEETSETIENETV
ncbi:hypothetical protein DMA11_12195 [Marinilabiliaceae bacterium JC017]|nr:hypothetical protein DMA11_12195 [Marinilabiliaceae bacterium JC017]